MLETAARTLDRVERTDALDGVVGLLRRAVQRVAPPGRAADLLHGTWLGHPLHPALTDVPVGAWVGAAVLDAVPGQDRAAATLVGVGLAGSLPSLVTGASDWSEAAQEQERIGLWHALASAASVGLYTASLVCRLTGRRTAGRRLASAGLACIGLAGYLGGHLAFRSGTGANQALAGWRALPDGWQSLGQLDALPERRLVARRLGDVPLLVYRDGAAVDVLIGQCAHLAGPLPDGRVVDCDGEACVECPWHGSVFRLRDGAVRHGPATASQPALEVRVLDGEVQARRPG